MTGRGRGRALTRPAWMHDEGPPPSLPASAKKHPPPTPVLPPNWAHASTPDGRTYWYNTKTNETTWTIPSVSHEEEHSSTPTTANSLNSEWKEFRTKDGRPYYYNAGLNQTRWDKPPEMRPQEVSQLVGAKQEERESGRGDRKRGREEEEGDGVEEDGSKEELEEGWAKYKTESGETYYANKVTGVTQFEKPEGSSTRSERVRKVRKLGNSSSPVIPNDWAEAKTEDGRRYYYNTKTMETSWKFPKDATHNVGDDADDKDRENQQIDVSGGNAGQEKKGEVTKGRKRKAVSRPRNPDGSSMNDKNAEKYFIAEEKKKRRGKRGGHLQRRDEPVIPAKSWTGEELAEGLKEFERLLQKAGVTSSMSWLEAVSRCVSDPLYLVCLPTHGHRKTAFLNYQAELRKQFRISSIKALRLARDNFANLLEEMFDDEPEDARGLSGCSRKKVEEFESSDRYKALKNGEDRVSLINLYFAHRDCIIRERRSARRKANMAQLRKYLDRITHPSLRPPDETRRTLSELNGKDVEGKEGLSSEVATGEAAGNSEAGQTSGNPGVVPNEETKKRGDEEEGEKGPLINERSSFREVCSILEGESFFGELNNIDRGAIYDDWMRDVTRILDMRILAEKEARKNKMRRNRSILRAHIESLIWSGDIHPRVAFREAEPKIFEAPPPSFSLSDLDVRPIIVFREALELVDRNISEHHDAFMDSVKQGGVEIDENSEVSVLKENKEVSAALDKSGVPEVARQALFYDAKTKAGERKRKAERRLKRARAEFEHLLNRKGIRGDALYEDVKTILEKRTAWLEYEELVGNDGVKSVFSEHVKREKEREERRRKRRAEEEAREAQLRKEAEERLALARRAQSFAQPAITGQLNPGAEEDSGWAVAISGRPKNAKEKAEEMERRKKEILAGINGLKADKMKKIANETGKD